jgi:hypothetical protein
MPREGSNGSKFPNADESLFEIRKLLRITAIQGALDRIEKLEWTEKQKAIWVLCDGKMTRKQLAQKSGAHLNTVKAFVEEAMIYGLLEEEKAKGGHPKRVIDYAPSEWKSYVRKKEDTGKAKKAETSKREENQGGTNSGKEAI